jgi:pimeloyl-ACP methyl ester carboxylesterase
MRMLVITKPCMTMAVKVPNRDTTITLADGRALGLSEWGDPEGKPVLWFHGTPGSRSQIPPDAPLAARERGLRLIGVDRPGTGNSTHAPRRTLLSWAKDVAELVDQHEIDRFALIGLSGGGPYVLACAHEMPERVVAGASLGGVAPLLGSDAGPPYSPLVTFAGRQIPRIKRALGETLSAAVMPLRPHASAAIDLFLQICPKADRHIFINPEMREMFSHDIVAGTREGIRGPVYDLALFHEAWGFSPRHIRVPIRFWHGEADAIVPPSHSRHLARLVPDSALVLVPGEGHFAGFTGIEAVLDTLLELWK